MTPEEFVGAVNSLGIVLEPIPRVGDEAQYLCPQDPGSPRRASVTLTEGLILADWALGRRVLEIGTGLGVSTVCLADGATEVVTVDPDAWVHESVKLPDNVVRVKSIEDVEGTFDLAFIDGEHGVENVRADIDACIQRLRPGGLIAFHDLSQFSVRLAVEERQWLSMLQTKTVGQLTMCGVTA